MTEDHLLKLLSSLAPKFCLLDPWPTILIWKYVKFLTNPITCIVSSSITGVFPDIIKHALVSPLIKKSLPELHNYRPISNINIISEVMERIVFSQLNQHIIENGINNLYQSAYKHLTPQRWHCSKLKKTFT